MSERDPLPEPRAVVLPDSQFSAIHAIGAEGTVNDQGLWVPLRGGEVIRAIVSEFITINPAANLEVPDTYEGEDRIKLSVHFRDEELSNITDFAHSCGGEYSFDDVVYAALHNHAYYILGDDGTLESFQLGTQAHEIVDRIHNGNDIEDYKRELE